MIPQQNPLYILNQTLEAVDCKYPLYWPRDLERLTKVHYYHVPWAHFIILSTKELTGVQIVHQVT